MEHVYETPVEKLETSQNLYEDNITKKANNMVDSIGDKDTNPYDYIIIIAPCQILHGNDNYCLIKIIFAPVE